ncbi:MAG TPA: SDR family NAD(P)-dependent oxidoreductase [Candidatus Baltobacteraceae bacterium]|nr:SDR family NAD(P)-dependent oxidoreductase [Candidatus Baltobacteraceae bacterium]
MRTSKPRTCIVTGASSGIGAALAACAARAGWQVLLVARRRERLETLAETIREHGGVAAALACDVTAKDSPQRIVAAAIAAFGAIDVVVNGAGSATPGALLEQTDALIDAQWQVHVAAPLRIARAALPYVRASHGGLVFVGSGLARVPAPMYGAYCAAKAAVRAAAMQLRRELRSDGVFVTYVDPGVVDTEFSQASGMEAHPAWWHGKPDAVAARILRGIERRANGVNAAPWQTAATVIGEWVPPIADAAMARVVVKPVAAPAPPASPEPPPAPAVVSAEPAASALERALEPVARRMERVKLSRAFVSDLLVPGTMVELHDAAMRWAGMPNKNERAAMQEVLETLSGAGYLQPEGEETWKVLRAAE